MSDDPHKKKIDAWFYSANEPHEVSYFLKKMKDAHPSKSEETVKKAIANCCDSIKPSEGRAKLEACVKAKLS
jgi:hypothetical protein